MTRLDMRNCLTTVFLLALLHGSVAYGQEVGQYQHWLELMAADQSFADRSTEIGRTQAFLEFLAEDSIVFRSASGGPVDALEIYSSEQDQRPMNWEAHYIDVSRAGDLGLSAGPLRFLNDDTENSFGHQVSIWRKNETKWELMVDIVVSIPGFLSLEVEPNFDDTSPVLEETASEIVAMADTNTMQTLIDADDLFERSINFRGGQRALLRYGLENTRVYLPGMAPAVGADYASSVYGAFLDNRLSTTNEIELTYAGGFLSKSKEMGYTYGTMSTVADESELESGVGFSASYMRLWRLTASNEWKIAVEVLRPF